MTDNEKKVWDELIPTWQSLAAIAFRTGLPVKTCEVICVQFYNQGLIKCSRARLDGHNMVHLFKKQEYMTVMGVKMPVESRVEA